MHANKYQLYLLEHHSESFNTRWSALIRISTEGKSLIILSSPRG